MSDGKCRLIRDSERQDGVIYRKLRVTKTDREDGIVKSFGLKRGLNELSEDGSETGGSEVGEQRDGLGSRESRQEI